MARALRQSSDRVISNADRTSLAHVSSVDTFWRALEESPHAFDLFFALRVLEAKTPNDPRLSKANHPYEEPVRVGQSPAQRPAGKLWQYAFGLFGPNGPLPNHLSELAHERSTNAKDQTLCAFADLFHHRAALLFYRAWANAQSVNALDRRADDAFSFYVGSLSGYANRPLKQGDEVQPYSLRHVSGHFVRHARNAEGIESSLEIALGTPVKVAPWQYGWLSLPPSEQTQLGRANASLGRETVAGRRVPDRQHRFRLRIGAMSLAQYRRLLPKGDQFRLAIDWVRNYIAYEYEWSMQLVLKREEVPMTQLGATSQLGWTTWVRSGDAKDDADDFVVMPEAVIRGPGHIED
jgi:type VI secretion system protein ImpH